MEKLDQYKVWIGVALLAVVAALIWWVSLPEEAPVSQWRPATPAPQLKATPKTTISPPKVAVFVPAAKGKLDLPPEVQADPKQHVIDATLVASDEHPQTVAVVINDETGAVQTFFRKEEQPLLAAEHRGRFGFGCGLKSGQQVGHVYLAETLVQVKGWRGGGEVHLFTDGTHIEELLVEYRW